MRKALIIMLSMLALAAAQEKPKIAVYVNSAEEQSINKALMISMKNALFNSGRFQVVDRSEESLKLLAAEHSKQRSGSTEDDQIKKQGKQLGVDFVCIVDITRVLGSNLVSASILNLETARIEATGYVDDSPLRTLADLTDASQRVVTMMLGKAPEPEPKPAPAPKPAPKYEPQKTTQFDASSIYFSFYMPSVTSFHDYKGQELKRNGITAMFGGEIIGNDNLFGFEFFFGGGALGYDIAEAILGIGLKKLFWIEEKWVAIPISVGFAWRMQFAEIEVMTVAAFIDDTDFFYRYGYGGYISESHLNESLDITKHNFDIMPSIDLQFFLGKNFSLYVGYMYRITFSSNFHSANDSDFIYTVPEEFNPLRDSKENIFGIPGTLRFGTKFHFN